MTFDSDMCPHGLNRHECDVCREAMKIKPQTELVTDQSNIDLDSPSPSTDVFNTMKMPKQKIRSTLNLKDRIQPLTRPSALSSSLHANKMSLFDQRKMALANQNGENGLQRKELTKIADIEKKFSKNKE